MYVHYSDKQVILANITYTQNAMPSPFEKPRGFWISTEANDGWESWCAENMPTRMPRLTHVHAVTLAPKANIVNLDSVSEMDRFADEYLLSRPDWAPVIRASQHVNIFRPIDWSRVAQAYDGIVIDPYQWARRNHDWYYGWDCASGCIWNTHAIDQITLREVKETNHVR